MFSRIKNEWKSFQTSKYILKITILPRARLQNKVYYQNLPLRILASDYFFWYCANNSYCRFIGQKVTFIWIRKQVRSIPAGVVSTVCKNYFGCTDKHIIAYVQVEQCRSETERYGTSQPALLPVKEITFKIVSGSSLKPYKRLVLRSMNCDQNS